MPRKRNLFCVETPLGYRVVLSRDRWREIIRFKHPAIAGQEATVRACLEMPKLVRVSANDADVHMYYRASGRLQLCVVVAPSGGEERFVVTAYLTKNIKRGTEIWTS